MKKDLEAMLSLSKKFVKPELLSEWESYFNEHTKDKTSADIINASIVIMQALSNGETPLKANEKTYDLDITGYMSGLMAETVVYFHPRGEEFRKYWNGQFVNEEEVEDDKVINPAIVRFKKEY